jgi:hypothetical protein
MEIVIRNPDNADKFAAIFQHIKTLTEHIAVEFDKTHMSMQCMDNAHVAIMEVSLPSSWFDVYELSDNNNVRIGFNATFLHRILSSRNKEQQIQLVYSSEDADRLMIHLTKPEETPEKSKEKKTSHFDKHFELPLIDIEEETMEIPDIEYAAELQCNLHNLRI